MSTEIENTERVTKVFEAFGRGDIDSILEQLSDDVRFTSHLDPVVPWAGNYSGKADVARYFTALGGAVEVTDHPVNALIAQADTVVAMGDVSFRVRETGEAGSSSWVYVWKLADGEIQSYDQYNDTGLADAFRERGAGRGRTAKQVPQDQELMSVSPCLTKARGRRRSAATSSE